MANNIIINADDFGFTTGVNQAILELGRLGILSATNVMANMPFAHESCEVARQLPDLNIGVHLNLTQGKPVCDPHEIRSIVDSSGHFYPLKTLVRRTLTGRVLPQHAHREIKAQVQLLQTWLGGQVNHWNSHEGIHRYEPFASLSIWVCKAAQLRAMRSHRHYFVSSPNEYQSWRRRAKETYYEWLSWRGTRHFRLPEGTLVIAGKDTVDVLRIIAEVELPRGTWELVVHPATTTDGLYQSILMESRIAEYQYLASSTFREIVANRGINLLNFDRL